MDDTTDLPRTGARRVTRRLLWGLARGLVGLGTVMVAPSGTMLVGETVAPHRDRP